MGLPREASKRYTVQRLEYWPTTKLMNAVVSLAARLGLGLTSLELDDIVRVARRQSGREDLGDPAFLVFTEKLLAHLRGAPLTPFARFLLRQTMITAARNRLNIRGYFERHPEALDIPIERPVFILGFPRTGTTLLQNLLTLESGRRTLRFWELPDPVPSSPDRAIDRRKRQRIAWGVMQMVKLVAPEQDEMHEVRIDSPEECWQLMGNTGAVLNYDLQTGSSEYGDWLMKADMMGPYREYRQQLQMIAHHSGQNRFVLKCPEHLWFLDALLAVFPDACIVWTHRDPAESVASYCSLISLNWRMLFGRVDPEVLGPYILERFWLGIERAMEARAAADQARFFDVDFRELVQDQGAMVRRIRDHFGLPHPPGADAALAAWLAQARQDAKGRHRDHAAPFGLEPDAIRARYAPYIERFSVPVRSGGR